jgi:hypothetical protein
MPLSPGSLHLCGFALFSFPANQPRRVGDDGQGLDGAVTPCGDKGRVWRTLLVADRAFTMRGDAVFSPSIDGRAHLAANRETLPVLAQLSPVLHSFSPEMRRLWGKNARLRTAFPQSYPQAVEKWRIAGPSKSEARRRLWYSGIPSGGYSPAGILAQERVSVKWERGVRSET